MAPEFVQECSDLCVLKNSTAQLEVVATGSQPLQIRWFKDNEPIKYGKRLKMSSDGEHCTLKISEVQPQDQGIYKCEISNKAGTQSCEAKITVEGMYVSFFFYPFSHLKWPISIFSLRYHLLLSVKLMRRNEMTANEFKPL